MMGNKLSMRVGIWVVVALTLALGWPGLVLGGVPYLWIFGARLPASGGTLTDAGEGVDIASGPKDGDGYTPDGETMEHYYYLWLHGYGPPSGIFGNSLDAGSNGGFDRDFGS